VYPSQPKSEGRVKTEKNGGLNTRECFFRCLIHKGVHRFIRDTQAALAKAKEADLVDVEMLRSIESAAASVNQVSISSESLASLKRAARSMLRYPRPR